jgi:hypothetical protein
MADYVAAAKRRDAGRVDRGASLGATGLLGHLDVMRIPEWSPETRRAEWLAPDRFQVDSVAPESYAGRPVVDEGLSLSVQDRAQRRPPLFDCAVSAFIECAHV